MALWLRALQAVCFRIQSGHGRLWLLVFTSGRKRGGSSTSGGDASMSKSERDSVNGDNECHSCARTPTRMPARGARFTPLPPRRTFFRGQKIFFLEAAIFGPTTSV